jgi:hypothetical protein
MAMFMRSEALQETLKDEPLSQRYPTRYRESHADIFVPEEMSIRQICDELRKLYAYNCGFPHENDEWNPGRKTCFEREMGNEYNVSCPHSQVHGVFRKAQSAAELVGKGTEGDKLYTVFRKENLAIDTIDNSCRPLYQITIDGTAGTHTHVETYISFLEQSGVSTNVQKGDGETFRERLSESQGVYAERILELRDEFLTLLAA